MARTQAADYENRRDIMLDKAAELYARSGFLGTSTADLAEAWGMSKSLLYHYFSSKEEILYEIMSAHMNALTAMAADAGRIADPKARLSALTHGFMKLYVGASSHHKVLIHDLDKLPDDKRVKIVSAQRELIRVVRETLEQLFPDLAERRPEATALTMLYFGMINWTHTWYDPKGPVAPSALADMAIDLLHRARSASA